MLRDLGARRLGDFHALVEGLEDDDAALAVREGIPEGAQLGDGLESGMDRPRSAPVLRVGEAPAHRHDATLLKLGVPDDDREIAADAVGVNLTATFIAAAAVAGQRLREVVDLRPRCLGCELAAHG